MYSALMQANRQILVVGRDGGLLGLDRTSGAVVWQCELPGTKGQPIDLAIHEGRVFAATEEMKLFCVDYATGRGLWSEPFQGPAIGGIPPSIIADDDQVLVGFFGVVTCFSLDGQQRWTQPAGTGKTSAGIGLPGNVRPPHRHQHMR